MVNAKVGIIGGSGLSDPAVLGVEKSRVENVETPFGTPSSPVLVGEISGVPVAVIARHGIGHRTAPGQVNYRANLYALKHLGCTHVLASMAAGSLQEDVTPGSLVLVDQFVDRTTKREQTYFDGTCQEFAGICHLPMAEPFCSRTRDVVKQCANTLNTPLLTSSTVVCIEGPRFSSRAESLLFRSWQCDLINMTLVPEVVLACELALCYISLAVVTDYDCWRQVDNNNKQQQQQQSVNVDDVMATFAANCDKVVRLFRRAVVEIAAVDDWQSVIEKRQKLVRDNTILPAKPKE